jgi:hypothetical protein
MIYLAGPYSHISPKVEAERAEAHKEAATMLMKEGYTVFSPIVYGVQFLDCMDGDAQSWADFNTHMLTHSDYIVLLDHMPGWKASKGVIMELKLAIETHTTVKVIRADKIGRLILKNIHFNKDIAPSDSSTFETQSVCSAIWKGYQL